MKKPTFAFPLRKKAAKTAEEPTVEITPESDPVMEDREDAIETPAAPTHVARSEEREAEASPAPREDESVMTEPKEEKVDVDVLPPVKEEASKEAEADDLTSDDVAYDQKYEQKYEQKPTPSLDDESHSTESHSAYQTNTPGSTPSFCNCFSALY